MIRGLRKWHLRIFILLAACVPVLYISALLIRIRPMPVQARPDVLILTATNLGVQVYEHGSVWEDLEIDGHLMADTAPPTRFGVKLSNLATVKHPDTMLYWSEDEEAEVDTVSDKSFFVGHVSGVDSAIFALPPRAYRKDGHLTLYSLAHKKVIATASFPTRSRFPEGILK